VKYAFMHNHADEFKIMTMNRVLGVSRSGFYRFRQRAGKPTIRQQQRMVLDKLVAEAFATQKMRAGSPRLVLDLCDQGYSYDRKTVAASMQRQNLRARAARKYKATTNSKHNLPVAPNLLAQDFSAGAPNQKRVSDITYLWTDEGWLYLAVIIDLFSRLVVGWAFSERMTAQLVCEALQMAL
jgi:putative transposase